MKANLIIHTASLYYWFTPYEQTLDDRIHTALDAGFDGVEISNGPSILTWRPRRDTVRRLRDKTVTVHAEILWGITLNEWMKAVQRLPFEIANTVFHPDELRPNQLPELARLPFPASIENMDAGRKDWRTAPEVQRSIYPGVGFTFDTAHASENGLTARHFAAQGTPNETHLSALPQGDYFNIQTAPHVPSSCPIVTVEGVIPNSVDLLETEVGFVKERLSI
jgi:hypothetical protein